MVKFSKQATKAAIDNKKGGRAFIPRVLGATKELKDHIYVISKYQAEKYIRTTEKISEYAGLYISKEMRVVVLTGKNDIPFNKPEQLGQMDAKNASLWEDYKIERSAYQCKVKKFEDNIATLFVVILGQCTERVKHRLKSDSEFKTLQTNYDVGGLLKKLRIMAFSTGATQHKCLTAHDAMRRFINIQQGPKESNERYLIRFIAVAEVKDELHGKAVPEKLITADSDAEQTSEKYNTMVFLCGADQARYGKLFEEYRNACLAKNDKYPDTLDEAVTLLSKYPDGQNTTKKAEADIEDVKTLEMSFAQMEKKGIFKKKGVKVVCYKCNQPGHIAPDCPMKDPVSEDGSIKSSSSRGSENEHWSGYQG